MMRTKFWYWLLSASFFWTHASACEASACKAEKLSLNYAIQETIQYQWTIRTSELNIETQLGLLQQAAGAFNTQFTSSMTNLYQFDLQGPLGLRKSDELGRITTTNIALSKMFRCGATYTLNYINTNTRNPLTIITEPPRSDNTVISISMVQPLLRNLFYSPATILEQTQCLQLEAARLQNIQNIAASVASTLSQYWFVVGTKKILAAFTELVNKLTEFAEVAEQLVKENQRGEASLQQPYANLANARVQKIAAEQNWIAAYNQLLFLMGRPPVDWTTCCIEDVEMDDFPPTDSLHELSNCRFEDLKSQIVEKRSDVMALQLLEDSALLNLASALNQVHPELNLLASFALVNTNTGPNSDLFESFPINHHPEKDFMFGVALNFPFCNDKAKGLVKQQKAALLQAEVNTDQLEGQILTALNTAFTVNNLLVGELKNAKEAAKEFRLATQTELVKLQEGLSTYFDVLALANDAATAKVQEVNVETMYFQNLIQLYFLTGNLIFWEKWSDCIEVVDFRNLIAEGCMSYDTSDKNATD